MAEPSPVLTSPPPAAGPVYRPLSIPALVAFILAAVYAGLVGVLGVMAFFSGKTLFLGIWVLLFPAIALVLSLVASRQIRNSDGAQGGQALATGAWWLSLLFGVGFAAYYFGTYLAVREQAAAFTKTWFTRLEEGKVNEAFLMTQDPSQRKFDKSADADAIFERYGIVPLVVGGKAPLVEFREKDAVQLVREGGPDTQVKSLGIKDWQYEQGGYRVAQTYLVQTPLASFEVEAPALGRESKEFEGRQWMLLPNELKVKNLKWTPLGQTLESWRQQAAMFQGGWLQKLHIEDLGSAYLDTVEPSQRAAMERTLWADAVAMDILGLGGLMNQGVAAGACITPGLSIFVADPDWQWARLVPSYVEFENGVLIRTDHVEARKQIRPALVRRVKSLCRKPGYFAMKVDGARSRVLPTGPDPAQIQVATAVQLTIYPEYSDMRQPELLAEVEVIATSESGPITAERQPGWKITAVNLLRGRAASDAVMAPTVPRKAQPKPLAPESAAPPPGSQQ